jgi:DNA ligase-1
VWLPELSLWLDPRGPRDFAFVSHAHSDHTGRHRETVVTPETGVLMEARMGAAPGIEHRIPYYERRDFGKFAITLIPAGHVLGSAQCLIESDAGSLLYTGDFKLRQGLSSTSADAVAAETLIMETTFGRPHYVFPPTADVVAGVVRFCRETLEDGDVPVLLGYSLGKAQEILAALSDTALPVMLHGAVAKITAVYEALGVRFPAYEKYRSGATAGHVVICPPSASGTPMMQKIARRRVAALTGWAMDPGAIHRMRCDAVFPLSDHAGYPDLLKHVEAVSPKRVLTLHGFAQDFARDLRTRGVEAWALTGADQLELRLSSERPHVGFVIGSDAPMEVSSGPAVLHGLEQFATLCGEIAACSGKLAKTRLLADYFTTLNDDDLRMAVTWLTGNPFSRASGRTLQIGWALIRRALIAVVGCTPSEFQAVSRRFNDAGLTTHAILGRKTVLSAWKLRETAELFEALAATRAPTSKQALLEDALREQSATSAMVIVKILTGDLRIGLKEGLVEDAIASAFEVPGEALREAHMLLGDLGVAALHARHGTLHTAELCPFRPVRAMLASPEPDAEAVWQRMTADGESDIWVEDKLDGIRAQLHVADGRVEIYSRDLRRITATFPEITSAMSGSNLGCVLDGEMIASDGYRLLGFAELKKRLGRVEPDLFLRQDIPVWFVAFDILWLAGESLFRQLLSERRLALESITLPAPLRVAPITRISSASALDNAFDAARKRGNEGLMIKNPESAYLPGRRGMAWIKLKKAAATLDVVVTSVEYGHGRRNQVLSDYTFSVRTPEGGLAVIGKAYSGLTDAELAALTPKFQKTTVRQRGRVFDVEALIVLEVAFDSIQPSTRHPSGFSLRFPRIVRIRSDKSPSEIDTIETASRMASRDPD